MDQRTTPATEPPSESAADAMPPLDPRRMAYWSIAIAAVLALLVLGRDLLIPFAVAVMIWYLINAVARGFKRLPVAGQLLPGWLCLVLSLVTMLIALTVVTQVISANVAEVSQAAPTYQQNFRHLLEAAVAYFGVGPPPDSVEIMRNINVGQLLSGLATTLSGLLGDAGLILIYVGFLLVEQRTFNIKLRALIPDRHRAAAIQSVIDEISRQIQFYIWIKTLMSLLTGCVSYIVLTLVGVDFAGFWAFVIFMLNFIPTIGSLLGVILPAMLTLVQFGHVAPLLIVLVGLGGIQAIIGNVVEPALMGRSLNLSSLVIILSLSLWGSIWGIIGMFLCVPLTVMMMIVCAHFPQTRGFAALLSRDGRIVEAAEPGAGPAD